jgi:hypothetical protein
MELRAYGIGKVIIVSSGIIMLIAFVLADLYRNYVSLTPVSEDIRGQRPPWMLPVLIAVVLVVVILNLKLPAPTFLRWSFFFLFVGLCVRWLQEWLFYGPSPMNVLLGVVSLTCFAIAIFFQVRHLKQPT